MPTYDYRCPQGHRFERFFRTISASVAELECPDCGASAQRQLSGGAGLMFKGSGFYLTDYGKNAHRKAGAPKAESTPETGATEGPTAESREPTASREPKAAESGAPKAESPKPAAGSSTPRAKSPKPKTDSPKPKSK